MKNLIGVNGDKNWLPHYRAGFQAEGGDEFPRPDAYSRMRRFGAEIARRLLKRGVGGPVLRRLRAAENAAGLGGRARNGNWWGNDTIWRTTIDLNKVVYLGDRRGVLGTPGRRVLNVYDGSSTTTALKLGAAEGNPMMAGIAGHPAALWAVKAGVTAGSIVVAERLWRQHRRAAAIGMMIVSNGLMAAVAAQNASVIRRMR